MMGDFNEILSNEDKLGGPLRPDSSFQEFNDMLRTFRMRDLMATGNSFSWGGKRNNMWIQCKLDRCVGNREWSLLFPSYSQTFLPKRGYDHRPVLLSLKSSHEAYRGSFRFDCRMLNYPQVRDEVCTAWSSTGNGIGASVFDRI